MSENHEACCCSGHQHISVTQNLDELDFERGLWYAALTGDVERVELLLGKGKNPKQTDNAGYTALHYAARNGHLKICKILLEAGACVNASTKSCHSTALHRAAYCGKVDVVKLLLEQPRCSVLAQDVDGKTCLHKAVDGRHWDVVHFLLHRVPELVNLHDKNGKLPLHYVDDSKVLETIQEKMAHLDLTCQE